MKRLTQNFWILILTGCANIIAPSGGDKDTNPPKIVTINTMENTKNTFGKTIKFKFNEYIQLNNWSENFYISPPTKKKIQKKIVGETLTLTINDSLEKNITYEIILDKCIKDSNEGNILDTLSYYLSIDNIVDSLSIKGVLKDSYTLEPVEKAWIMLFDESIADSIIFKTKPNYISKTNAKGQFNFSNLKNKNYKIVALTGFDFFYNTEEKIAFKKGFINTHKDSFITLLAFNNNITSTKNDSLNMPLKNMVAADSLNIDSINNNLNLTGKLQIVADQDSPCIIQLLQNGEVIYTVPFNKMPFLIKNIKPAKYNLKYIADVNQDKMWNTGNWERKIQPEKIINYPAEIIIRSNWDLELEWAIPK